MLSAWIVMVVTIASVAATAAPSATASPAFPAAATGVHATQEPAVGPAPAAPSAPPTFVEVERVGLRAAVIPVGTLPDGAMEVPEPGRAGWFNGSSTPGTPGPTVIAGHVDSWTGPDVFYRLPELVAGDRVRVHRADGAVTVYEVTRLEEVAKEALPVARVFGPSEQPSIRLITCGGEFDRQRKTYRSNVIVYGRLVTG